MTHAHTGKAQRGASLIEILIAMLITTVGLLGFAGIQSRALVAMEDTYERTQATTFAQDMMERMRSNGVIGMQNQSNAYLNATQSVYTLAGNWTGTVPTQNCLGTGSTCTAAQMALYDIGELRRAVENSANLPSGTMLVSTCGGNQLCVTVAWGTDTASNCAASNWTSGGLVRPTCIVVQGT